MPRFAILRHDAPSGVHYDLLLESGDVLRTWSLPEPPEAAPRQIATALPDHRLLYLHYEGEISGGRGTVTRYDQGEYEIHSEEPTRLVAELRGGRLAGQIVLERIEPEGQWQFEVATP